MNNFHDLQEQTAFHQLTPDVVIAVVENALDTRCTNLCRPLVSYINRVYELEKEDGDGLVVKFYRPGRWSEDGLRDEHDFLFELQEQEIPVIAPLVLNNAKTLGLYESMHFAVYKKKGGRSFDEYNDEQWLELGRLLGRTHGVGAKHLPKDRITLAPDRSTRQQVDFILAGNFMPLELEHQFREVTETIIKEISPLFEDIEMIRIHGDCHFSNLIYRPEESFFLIDFDDMSVGPPIQDVWMLLPDYAEKSMAEIEIFLEGYETFREFNSRSLQLIEPLRAMRFIHYTAWCAHQVVEDGLSRVAPDFKTYEYWQREILDLNDQLVRIVAGN